MTCKDSCIHYPVCKDTVADENWTDEAPELLKEMYSPKSCKDFSPRPKAGIWIYYSTTMMECSECKKHVPRHRYKFCPECGSAMIPKVQPKHDEVIDWEQLTLF
jgi:Zn finger protein HypA/HybF involved in hydrogenase expression